MVRATSSCTGRCSPSMPRGRPHGESEILERCGLSGIATPHLTTSEDIDAYAARGFAAIGIWLHKLERGTVRASGSPRRSSRTTSSPASPSACERQD